MNKISKILTSVTLLVTLCSSTWAQGVQFPVLLTQSLPSTLSSIIVCNDFEVRIVCDTANYVDVKTTADITQIDSLRFPEGKLKLTDGGTQLVFNNEFPYHSGITVHTTAQNLIVHAIDYSKVALSSRSKKIELNNLSIRVQNEAFVEVEKPVEVKSLVTLYVDNYANIRHRKIEAANIKKMIYGRGRINDIDGMSEESYYAEFFNINHHEIPIFFDFSIGLNSMGITPYGGFNAPTGNFIWSTGFYLHENIRYAFWQREHWSLSSGIGLVFQNFKADNAYLDMVTDNATGEATLSAVDASALFAAEEAVNGHIMWNSSASVTYIGIPIRLEWRYRPDYKGVRASIELRPSFAVGRNNTYLIRNGFYQDKHEVASTRNERFGKYINPFRLDMRLSVTYRHIEFFGESSLTPMFRTDTDNQDTRPAIDQKLYPVSLGICFTF